MIAQLVRRHVLFDCLLKLLGLSLVAAILLANIVTFALVDASKESEPGGLPILFLQLVVTGMAAGGLLLNGASRRISFWHLGLPIPSVTIWRSHYLALLIGMLELLLAQLVVILVFVRVMSQLIPDLNVPWSQLVVAFVSPALVLIFVGGVVAGYRTELADLSEAAGWQRFRWTLLVAAMVQVAVLSYLPLVVGLLPAVIGGVLAGRGRRSVPPALQLGNESARSNHTPAAGAWDRLANAPLIYRPYRLYLGNSVLDQLFKIPYRYYAFMALFVCFFAALLGGWNFYDSKIFNETLRFNNIFITVYLMFALTGEFVLKLHKIDHLPVSRRVLLMHLVLPTVISLLVGYGWARVQVEHTGKPVEMIHFQNSYGKYGASVAPTFQMFGMRGDSLQVTAPWGETHVAVARHPVPAYPSGFALQSSFLTDDGPTSDRFLAWQLSRAVEHVYGAKIAPEELESRYFSKCEDGSTCIPRGSFTVARDFNLKPRPGGPLAPLLLGPIISLYFLVTAFYFTLLRDSRSVPWARTTWWVFMGGLFLLHILQVFDKIPLWNKFGGSALVFAGARELGEMGPLGHGLAYGAALAAVFLTWRLCFRAFQNLEAPR